MESQKTPNRQNNFKVKEQNWRYCVPWFWTILQSYSNIKLHDTDTKTDNEIEQRAQKQIHTCVAN